LPDRAFDADAAAVRLNRFVDNCQPQPCALNCFDVSPAMERLKQALDVLFADADSLICNGDARLPACRLSGLPSPG